jgi:isopentenyl-diphosphate Delta-isomerase
MPRTNAGRGTPSRKKQHVAITLAKDVRFRTVSTGLDALTFVHNALPELDLAEIDTGTRFLGKPISFPLLVSCMTGGYPEALAINRDLALLCASAGIALGVGSQRQAMENSRYHRSFSVVREVAPSIPIIGNIGGAEVAQMKDPSAAQRLVDLIRADAFAVHLNPLQELLQMEGTPRFRGVLEGITLLVRSLPVPVIVKEIGAGISGAVARRLLDAGVKCIDVAGAGGTSWAGVEALRSKDRGLALRFWDWGIPTADALRDVASLRKEGFTFSLIASGGVASGLDMAKCCALGADIAASARPILLARRDGGRQGMRRLVETWRKEFRTAMFLTGSRTPADLRIAPLLHRGLP